MDYSKITKKELAEQIEMLKAKNADLALCCSEQRNRLDKYENKTAEPDLYSKAVTHFGEHSRLLLAIEEMSELTKELLKRVRGRTNVTDISEEMADVEIMLEQLKIIFRNRSEVECVKARKLQRLADKLEYGE